jgi:hypothetical protein
MAANAQGAGFVEQWLPVHKAQAVEQWRPVHKAQALSQLQQY